MPFLWKFALFVIPTLIHCVSKKGATFIFAITLAAVDRF